MSNAEEIRRLSKQKKEIVKKKQTAAKRKAKVDKAKSHAEGLSNSDFNKNFSSAVQALQKGLSPLSTSFDVSLSNAKAESENLNSESGRLQNLIYSYESDINTLEYKIKNLQIEED